ncbi:MAG: hypothetical protein ABEI54_00825, partial [Candidatus Bipolaricaulia bacterium]
LIDKWQQSQGETPSTDITASEVIERAGQGVVGLDRMLEQSRQTAQRVEDTVRQEQDKLERLAQGLPSPQRQEPRQETGSQPQQTASAPTQSPKNISVNVNVPESVMNKKDVDWLRKAASDGVSEGITRTGEDSFNAVYG